MAVVSTFVNITSGVTVSGDVVVSGGYLNVTDGTIIGTTVSNGGATFVTQPSGTASGTIVDSGGKQFVAGGVADSTLITSGGQEFVYGGGIDTSATVTHDGVLTVVSGGTVSAPTIDDPSDRRLGTQIDVTSGGIVTGGAAISGGLLEIDKGAVFRVGTSLILKDDGHLMLGQNTFAGSIKFAGHDDIDLQNLKFEGSATPTWASGIPHGHRRKQDRRS